MRLATLLFFMFLSVTLSQQGLAQQSERITGFFPGISFSRFVDAVERDTPFRIYFKNSDVDSLTVSLTADDDRIEDVLNEIFKGTSLTYTLTQTKEIFITKDRSLVVEFPADYFQRGRSSSRDPEM